MTCARDSNHKSDIYSSESEPYITVNIQNDNTSIHHVIEEEF